MSARETGIVVVALFALAAGASSQESKPVGGQTAPAGPVGTPPAAPRTSDSPEGAKPPADGANPAAPPVETPEVTGSGVKSLAEKTPEELAEEEKLTELAEPEIVGAIELARARAGGAPEGEFPALAAERRKRAVLRLAELPHPKTFEALQKLQSGPYEDDVRAAAAFSIGHMKFAREAAAKFLVRRIDKDWDHPEVLVGIARGLGELQLVPDREEMHRFFRHPSDEVYVSMIVCLAQIKDVPSLPRLHQIFSQFGKMSTQSVSVRVDTGTAGSGDQRAAEARGRAMQQQARPERRKGAIEAVTRAVKDITGIHFEYADKFHEWLKANEKKLKIKIAK
jgi:hypothetical protein